MAAANEITTARQLFEAPNLGRCELVRGELVMLSPAGFEHGVIAGRLLGCLYDFVARNGLGVVVAAGTGFQIGRDPDTVRAPDVGFICTACVPRERTRGYFPGPPDLGVEVVSPDDRAGEVLAKVRDWLSAGCQAVWVVDPTSQTVSVYRGLRDTAILTADDELTDEKLLPGFRLPVAEVL
jgi:Uma2 family endonuclease